LVSKKAIAKGCGVIGELVESNEIQFAQEVRSYVSLLLNVAVAEDYVVFAFISNPSFS
jgi:hypothetical protein